MDKLNENTCSASRSSKFRSPPPRKGVRRKSESSRSPKYSRKRSTLECVHDRTDSAPPFPTSPTPSDRGARGRPAGRQSKRTPMKQQKDAAARKARSGRWSSGTSDSDIPASDVDVSGAEAIVGGSVTDSDAIESGSGEEVASDISSLYQPDDTGDCSDSSFEGSDLDEEESQMKQLSQNLAEINVSQPSTPSDSDLPASPPFQTSRTPTASESKVGFLTADRDLKRHAEAEPTKASPKTGIWPEDLSIYIQQFRCNCMDNLPCREMLEVTKISPQALASPFRITCTVCGKSEVVSECEDLQEQVILTSLLHGLDYSQVNPLLLSMGLPSISEATFKRRRRELLDPISDAAEKVLKQNVVRCKEAAEKCGMKPDAKGLYHVPGIVDGSWKTKGFQSRHGVVVVTCQLTGLPIDFAVLSKDCDECKAKPSKPHYCTKNHYGSSGSMEKAGAEILWNRSIEKNGLILEWYLGDGDCKGFGAVQFCYDGNPVVKKIECRNHFLKRFEPAIEAQRKDHCLVYNALRKEHIAHHGPKPRGMKKNLKAHMSHYLRNIRYAMADAYIEAIFTSESAEVAEALAAEMMREGILCATRHMCSDHSTCPAGRDSWCVAQRVEAGEPGIVKEYWPPSYCSFLETAIKNLIKPDMMCRVVYGLTQNQNESFNSVIWITAEKRKHHGGKRVRMSAAIAVIRFSRGTGGFSGVFSEAGIAMSSGLIGWYDKVDARRVQDSVARKGAEGDKRRWRRAEKAAELRVDLEDDSYRAGCGN